MNRTELIESVAARAGSDQAAARRHVDAVFNVIMEKVAAGDRVLVTGFGTFDRVARPARKARNPRTGVPIEVAAVEAPRFRIGQTFKNRVAGNSDSAVADTAEEAPAVVTAAAAKKPKKSKKAVEKPAKKPVEKPAKKPAKKAVEKPAKKAKESKPAATAPVKKAVKAGKTAKGKAKKS